jgi:tetratricopeptide (TPR) repeat protein
MLVAVLVPSNAMAQRNKAQGQRAFNAGKAAFERGRFDEAAFRFEEAYDLTGKPQVLFYLSQAYEEAGKTDLAIDALERYLPTVRAKDRPTIQARIEALRKKASAPATPTAGPTTAGPTTTHLAAASPMKLDALVKHEGDNEVLSSELEPEQARTERLRRTQAEIELHKEGIRRKLQADEEQAALRAKRLPGWILAGAGVAAVLTAIPLGVAALGAQSEAKNGCDPNGVCAAKAVEPLQRGRTFALATDVLLASGLTAAALGVTWLFLTGTFTEHAYAALPGEATLTPLAGGFFFGWRMPL